MFVGTVEWDMHTNENYDVRIANGGYTVTVFGDVGNNVYAFPLPNQVSHFSNFQLSFDIELVKSVPSAVVGAACRIERAGGDGYVFYIKGDGRYSILKRVNGIDTFLVSRAETEVDFDITDLNRITISCIDDTLAFQVNGETITVVQDSDLVEGWLALIVGSTSETESAIARFDNVRAQTANRTMIPPAP